MAAWRAVRWGLRSLAFAGLTALAGCSQIHLDQAPDAAIVRVGSLDRTVPARPLARRYAPYAVMAAKAREPLSPEGQRIGKETSFGDSDAAARAWIRPWRFEKGQFGPLCANSKVGCSGVNGLQYHIWSRPQGRICREVAIVLLGTDPGSLGDWLSNLHWVLRVLPLNDQYDQMQTSTGPIVADIKKNLSCAVTPATRIVAVGHSLGGGLAHQAAYMTGDIRQVYAFNPSPVTGFGDPDTPAGAGAGVTVDRIYEHGEALAYLRLVQRQIAPPSVCRPEIRTVRFNLIQGNIFRQHSMVELAKSIVTAAGPPDARGPTAEPPPALPQDKRAEGCLPPLVASAR
jgi:pimeloyl-ACP methyl ester carboxylesterase